MICALGAAGELDTRGPGWTLWLLVALALLFLVGALDALTTRLRLYNDRLEMRKNFKTTVVRRADLKRVVAERGAPIALEFEAGGWLRLPETISGLHGNTLRAWLKQGAQSNGPTSSGGTTH